MSNTYRLTDFLNALFPKRDYKPQIKLTLPRGETESAFRKPFVYTDINLLELSQGGLVSNSLRESNKSQNVLIRTENALSLMLNSQEQFETLNTFNCSPSIKLQFGNRIFAIWLINQGEDIKNAENALLQLFKTKTLTDINGETWLPLPEFNLVEMSSDGNHLFTPIKIIYLNDSNRYRTAELIDAADTAISQKLHFAENESEVLNNAQIESAVLDIQNKSVVSQNTSSKNPISKGERTYQNFVRLINVEMPKSVILESAFSELGLKSRRVAYLLKSAVSRNDIAQTRHGRYAPKINSAVSTDLELPLAE